MRIAVVSVDQRPLRAGSRDWITGSAVHMTELSAALARLGHDVRVYTRRSSPSQPEQATDADGITLVNAPIGPARTAHPGEQLCHLNPFGQWLDRSWRDDWAPDVVHAHTWPSAVAALVAKKMTSRPTVVTFHGVAEPLGDHGQGDRVAAFRRRVEQAAAGEADAVLALSHSDAHHMRRLGIPRTKVSVIPPGVDTAQFQPSGPAWNRRRPHRILAVGQLIPSNGFADTVAALPGLPDTELVIIGRPPPPSRGLGPHAAALRASAVNTGTHDRLRLTGAVPYRDMPGWYRSADLLVCTPSHASLNRAALEAMACGVPVMAAATGGLSEAVTDGTVGRLIPPGSPAQLVATIHALLTDPELRGAYGLAGIERARLEYSWHQAAQRTLDTYRRTLGHHVAAPRGRQTATAAAA
ncbi:glycosyltransferase [Micromonospora sp. CPCC 206061]|uniref:glycosyltransferase n=1 Tax=Micromonospora sp. CPCC 206061 TaxID=3122410 RepID=UPI002FF32296